MTAEFIDALVARKSTGPTTVLRLLGDPHVVREGIHLTIPEGGKRLLVFVALQRRRIERRYAANMLWPTGDEGRAGGNLRSALWRLGRAGIDVLVSDKNSLTMSGGVLVDVHLLGAWAGRMIDGSASDEDLMLMPGSVEPLDLLPGWYDEWLLMERERLRQRVLHSLEAQSRRLVRDRRCAQGVEAAVIAVAAEPLRESAQRALIEAHLAEGNRMEGRRAFDAYRLMLRRELGVEPDPDLAALVGGPVAGRGPRRHRLRDHSVA
jgi:DNA-binding SARP family transcriptional activator